MDVSANIKAIRNANGIAQAELARRLDMDPSSYHRLENRGNKLSLEQLEAIAGALGVPILQLMTWGENKEPEKGKAQEVAELQGKNDELKKRIKELEDRVSDKSEIIDNLKLDYEAIKEIVNNLIESPIAGFALTSGIGNVLLRNEIENTTRVVSMEEFNTDNSSDLIIPEEYVEDIELTDEEMLSIIKVLIQNHIYEQLLHDMVDSGNVRDKQIVKLYNILEKKRLNLKKRS